MLGPVLVGVMSNPPAGPQIGVQQKIPKRLETLSRNWVIS